MSVNVQIKIHDTKGFTQKATLAQNSRQWLRKDLILGQSLKSGVIRGKQSHAKSRQALSNLIRDDFMKNVL